MKENESKNESLKSIESDRETIISDIEKQNQINPEILSDLKNIDLEKNNIISIANNLNLFNYKLKSLKNFDLILTSDVLLILQNIEKINSIQIDLVLSKIYNSIIDNEWIDNSYIIFDKNYMKTLDKINILLYLINKCTSLIEKLQKFWLVPELFQLKVNILKLINHIYMKSKEVIEGDDKLYILIELSNTLPSKFFSKKYLELKKKNDLFEIISPQNINKISSFEDVFLDLNDYYEQFDVFKKFIEINCKNDNNSQNNDNIEFYCNFGTLMLKFCKYHRYIFLNQKESEEEKKLIEKLGGETENNIKAVFLYEKSEFNSKNQNSSNNLNYENILENKRFISTIESDEYLNLIKKGINYYLDKTKNFEKNEKISQFREQMIYYIKTLEVDSYVPLYLKDFKHISFSDNFCSEFTINIPAGEEKKIYLETKYNEQALIYIEFFLDDKSKDISFEVNKYDAYTNSFNNLFHENKINKIFKCFILSKKYALYEIVFNNDYSWFNNKILNYKISLLKLDNSIILKPSEFFCNINEQNIIFNSEVITKKIENKENEKIINIPVIFYLNNLRIISLEKNEKGNNIINYKEIIEENEKYIPHHLFDYSLMDYLIKKKIKPEENKKIVISIFSQNRDLVNVSENIEEKISRTKNEKDLQYLKKIGFVPSEKLWDYKVEYELYDLCEQIIVYHLYLCKYLKKQISKTILNLNFDKLVVNYSIYDDGKISTKLKEKLDDIDDKSEESIFNFIKNTNRIYGGICLVLSQTNYNTDEEKEKKLTELFEHIKKYCIEQLEPKVPLFIYSGDDLISYMFNYLNLFYSN